MFITHDSSDTYSFPSSPPWIISSNCLVSGKIVANLVSRNELLQKNRNLAAYMFRQCRMVHFHIFGEYIVFGREAWHTTLLDHPQIVEYELSGNFQIAHQPQFIIASFFQFGAFDARLNGAIQRIHGHFTPILGPIRRYETALLLLLQPKKKSLHKNEQNKHQICRFLPKIALTCSANASAVSSRLIIRMAVTIIVGSLRTVARQRSKISRIFWPSCAETPSTFAKLLFNVILSSAYCLGNLCNSNRMSSREFSKSVRHWCAFNNLSSSIHWSVFATLDCTENICFKFSITVAYCECFVFSLRTSSRAS